MSKDKVAAGDVFNDQVGEFRIMAVVDGYVMARRKGAMPFVTSLKTLATKFDVLPAPKPNDPLSNLEGRDD